MVWSKPNYSPQFRAKALLVKIEPNTWYSFINSLIVILKTSLKRLNPTQSFSTSLLTPLLAMDPQFCVPKKGKCILSLALVCDSCPAHNSSRNIETGFKTSWKIEAWIIHTVLFLYNCSELWTWAYKSMPTELSKRHVCLFVCLLFYF